MISRKAFRVVERPALYLRWWGRVMCSVDLSHWQYHCAQLVLIGTISNNQQVNWCQVNTVNHMSCHLCHQNIQYWTFWWKEADTDSYSESVKFYEEISEVAKGEVLEHYRKQCGEGAFGVQPCTEIKMSWLLGRFTQKIAIATFVETVGNIPAHGQIIKAAKP
jgi:hypothetical protein